MCKSEVTEFLAELTEFAAELSEFFLLKQYSRNSISPILDEGDSLGPSSPPEELQAQWSFSVPSSWATMHTPHWGSSMHGSTSPLRCGDASLAVICVQSILDVAWSHRGKYKNVLDSPELQKSA